MFVDDVLGGTLKLIEFAVLFYASLIFAVRPLLI